MTIAEWWSGISEAERIEHVGNMPGVWVFGGVQMVFAMLPKEAKAHLYNVFALNASGYARMTWEQLAEVISVIRAEAQRRNPIGINMYVPYLQAAEAALLEIGAGEKDNPTSEAGPTVPPPFGWEVAPQWAKDAKDDDAR